MSDIFNTLGRQIQAANVRHGVIASNIANVDTPGFKARDVKFDEALETATIELRKTSPAHMGFDGGAGASGGNVAVESRPSWGDGNNVELDVEVAKMTENAVFFQTAVTLLSTNIRMFKTALRR
ncbi:MAG: flagellar basal-body rod protein FlgB [Deltaproteobacteria bacterium CG2_30_66_27]|nr:MAG: flagellar basal-body rod protein FlgB [Deltaproteobacteria bacterium CG2_30_66_27]